MITKRVLIVMLLLVVSTYCVGQTKAKVYSILLYSLAKSLQWPAESAESNDEFIVGVMDKPDLVTELETIAVNKLVGTRKLSVKRITSSSEIKDCEMVFISSVNMNEFLRILEMTKADPVLIVTEQEGLGSQGSNINFFIAEGKLRFEFNLKTIEARGIKMPGNLKSLGVPVGEQVN